ncbi:MAG: DUF2335 domain-containing protein [Actinomycetota bacterium]|nr:DUF2335 domain-containing protein [Actinomycetota bacterium]
MTMAEKEQDHRHVIIERGLEATIEGDKRGQWMGFSIAALGLVIAAVLGIFGSPVAATAIGVIDLVALVGLFVKRSLDEAKAAKGP